VALLLRTLFDPFRQISAGQVRGPLDVQVRAFADRLFSRVFGAVVRSFFIFIGLIATLGIGLFGVFELIMWPLVPLFPVFGIVLAVMGWTP
jgi:fatty acid desaturase